MVQVGISLLKFEIIIIIVIIIITIIIIMLYFCGFIFTEEINKTVWCLNSKLLVAVFIKTFECIQ